MRKRGKILIIENAALIQHGLSYILTKKNKTSLSLNQHDETSDLHAVLNQTMPHILIATPSFFEKNDNLIQVHRNLHGLQIIALLYAHHHPATLTHFDGFIYLHDKSETITATIDKLLLPPSTTPKVHPSTSNDMLSEREKEVLKLLAQGSSTKQIAETLFISPHTVNAHRKNIMRKLDIKTISGLTIYAVLNNIITLPA